MASCTVGTYYILRIALLDWGRNLSLTRGIISVVNRFYSRQKKLLSGKIYGLVSRGNDSVVRNIELLATPVYEYLHVYNLITHRFLSYA